MDTRENIRKWDIVLAVHKNSGHNQTEVYKMVCRVFEYMKEQLIAGKNIELRGFGSFRIKRLKDFIGRNPKSPKADILVKAHNIVRFSPGQEIKDGVSVQALL